MCKHGETGGTRERESVCEREFRVQHLEYEGCCDKHLGSTGRRLSQSPAGKTHKHVEISCPWL